MSGHLRVLTRREWRKHYNDASYRPAGVAWTLSPLGVPIEVSELSTEIAVCDSYFSPPPTYSKDQADSFLDVRPEILAEVYFRAGILESFAELVAQHPVAAHILALRSKFSYYPQDVEAAQALVRTLVSLWAAKSALNEIQQLFRKSQKKLDEIT